MKELLNLKLTPDKDENNQEIIKLIDKLTEDNELFKQFLVELVEKYIEVMDQKTIDNNTQLLKKYDKLETRLDEINHHVSVNVNYDPEIEEITIA